MSGRKSRDPARVARDRLIRREQQERVRAEAQAVAEGVAETVALSRARGQAVAQSASRKRLQPYRRQSGLEGRSLRCEISPYRRNQPQSRRQSIRSLLTRSQRRAKEIHEPCAALV